ncbi:MAG: aldehyde dehydrogenase [Bdellovibrionales bacterium]|nr:aldehyde dehydrogenase [Bdellovibrionales bacterium]
METINPATEERIEIEETPISQIPELVAKAKSAQIEWGQSSLEKRSQILNKLCLIFEAKKDLLAKTITEDMGKPIKRSYGEVEATIRMIKFYCEHASKWLAPESIGSNYVSFDPLGIVAVISPWNYPLKVSMENICAALITGNAVVYKPSEYALKTGQIIIEMFKSLDDFPENLLQIIIGAKDHGKTLVEQDIQMVALVGSTAAGKNVMQSCSKDLKRVLLELGGMDAAIVLKDADIEKTAQKIIERNTSNTGQVCCSIKRVYVEKEVYQSFVEEAVKASKTISFGNPYEDVIMGPLVAKFQLEKIETIIEDARQKGATIHTGGTRENCKGYFYPSTVVTDLTADMKLMTEEAFGPILPIMPISSAEEGIDKANNSKYGLTGSIWTKDIDKGKHLASMLKVGVAAINSHGRGTEDLPWGGAKESGIGRQSSKEGMRGFCNTKAVHVHKL